jgi:hypothetical protein
VRTIALWPRIVAAASVVLFLAAGSYFYFHYREEKQQAQNQLVKHDVLPGGNRAYLTLGDGKRITLTGAANGRIAQQSGVTISKTGDGRLVYQAASGGTAGAGTEIQYNTIETPMGGQYQVVLPDGSRVWLNAASSLRYPARFAGSERRVELTGEAYFEVVHNSQQPFRVQSAGQLVEDVGTHFNINSYADEPVRETTLLEGAVKVQAGGESVSLVPGQQAVNSGGGIRVERVNTGSVTDWKDGRFYLNRLDFKVAMRKIARWYNVGLVYDDEMPKGIQSGGWIPRNTPLSVVLESIESTGLAHFRLEGRELHIRK